MDKDTPPAEPLFFQTQQSLLQGRGLSCSANEVKICCCLGSQRKNQNQRLKMGTVAMIWFWASVAAVLMSCGGGVAAYKNYTVGDSLGWYDRLLKPDVDYDKWVAGKNFSLGDFLIFNTDTNHTVVQTYNSTTFKSCDYDDAEDDDTTEWSSGNPSYEARPVTVAVPLLKEGITYFFSGDYDGEQCKNGQKFQISVAHGRGLPPSLLQPPPAPPDDDDTDGDSSPFTDNNIPPSASDSSADTQPQNNANAALPANIHVDLQISVTALLFFLVVLFI